MENKYSLTFPQKNIWLVEKFFGKSPINTIVGIFNVNKEFDKDICEKAVNKMVEVNDALRIKVIEENDEAVQYVDNYAYFSVDFFDVTDKTPEERKELENELTTLPFEVVNSPLYYFAIVKIGEDKGYIFVKLHHLVSDAWTFGNVATSLAEYVDLLTENREEEITKPSYVDFIKSEQEYIKSDKFIKDKEFWNEYLSGLEENVGLKENNNETLIDAKRYTVKLDEKLNTLIKDYCKENRVSPYTVFMNALAIYLHRVTEKTDFVIGTPVLNRSNFKEKKMMGMFVSTMPVRFKIDEKETFLEMCKKSASETMTLFRHQKYPYSLMLQDFREKNKVNNNLYSIMISYQNARAEYSDNEKYTTDWMFSTKVQDQFAIHIMDMDETGTLQLHFDYLVDLFEDIEIEYISKRIFTIIEDGITNNKTIETVEIMPEEEKNKILYEFNDTKRDYPKDKTVIGLFEEQVEKTPDNIALVFAGKEMTYKELNEKANSLAWYLKEQGIRSGDMVGILIDKSFELIISILALLKLGICYIPLEKNYNKERKEFILKNAGCKNILVDEKEDLDMDQINVYEIKLNKNSKVVNSKSNTPDTPNCVLYTSGTTGEPKGTIIVDRNIIKLVRNADYLTFEKNDSILQAASTSFDVSLFEIWGALLNGASLHIIKKMNLINPSYLKRYLLENNISILWITSALFNQMIEADATMFSKLRRIFTGGDVISIKHVNMLKDVCSNLMITNCYGPTECVAFTNTYNIFDKVTKRIPLGPAISNTTGYVIDSKNRLLPLYVPGEYIIGGESVGLEYINNKELTNQKFIFNYIDNKFEIDRMYKTGDIVQMISGGNIDFIGRRDNQIKIRGYRIELDEIKIAMQSFGSVKDAVAIVKTCNNNKQIYGYYTSKVKEDNVKFFEYLKTKIPKYMIPSRIMQLEYIPINQNGKIDRKNLPEIEIEFESKEYDIKNYTGIYKTIYNIFSEITGVENILPTDSFFDIGGDSISVIKVISKLSKKNLSVTFQDIYKYPSIEELGNMLHKHVESESISKHLYEEDYSKINKLLSNNIVEETIQKNNNDINKNILLTGATGFLGSHILKKYLEKNKSSKIYCLVRRKDGENPKERLEQRLEYFFGKEYVESIQNKVIVIEGDTIKDDMFVNESDKELIIKDVDCIINSAAHVKHFGDLELFNKINTESVDTLARFALNYDKKLIQISTLSVSGNILENGQIEQTHIKPGTIFNENKLFIGQNLDNVYAYTKFMGEKIIYDYIINDGLKAKVIRMGNLTGRFIDGKFQPNAEENAFAQRLKTIIELGVLPDNLLDFDVEFTPIDYAAEAVVTLVNTEEKYNTFHLFNDNHIKMEELNKIFKDIGIDLKIITKTEMTNLMKELINNDYSKIQGIVQDLNSSKELDYKPNTKIREDFTKYVLEKNGFKWPVLDDKYIKKYLKNLYDIKFLKESK